MFTGVLSPALNDARFGSRSNAHARFLAATRAVAIAGLSCTLGLVALPVLARVITASIARPAAHAGVPRQARSIPAGLEAAIERSLGPGASALGGASAPSRGITTMPGGWDIAASRTGISTTVGPNGALAVHTGSSTLRAAFSARALGTPSSPTLEPLRTTSTAVSSSTLTQQMGAVTTSYQRGEAGVEQRFTVRQFPAEAGRPFALDLGPANGWRFAEGGRGLVSTGAIASGLAYNGLHTTDAGGNVVPSHFEIVGRLAEIVVDPGSSASLPITIDPNWTTTSTPTAQLTDGVTPDDLGSSVALSQDGTTAIVGAPGTNFNQGAAYVFHVNAEGSWTTTSSPTATLSAPGLVSDGTFGSSVAISSDGTTAVVGAYQEPWPSSSGKVYVYHVSAEGSWVSTSTPAVTLSPSSSVFNFGISVALSGDGTTALVGATFSGGFVYHVSSESAWASATTPAALTTASESTSWLGERVALSSDGSTAFVAAPRASAGPNTLVGAVEVYQATSESSWASSSSPLATLSDSTDGSDTFFGDAVAASSDGTTVAVGAPSENSGAGGIDVFHVSAESSWSTSSTPTATLTKSASPKGLNLGSSVSVSGNGSTVAGGADLTTPNTAYIFNVSSESSWVSATSPTAVLTSDAGAVGYEDVDSVALSNDGTLAMLGAAGVGANGVVSAFSASSQSSWSTSSTPGAVLSVPANGTPGFQGDAGTSVALSSDGTTAFVGEPDVFEGAVFVFETASPGTWTSSSAPIAELSDSAAAGFGSALAVSSDGTTVFVGDSSSGDTNRVDVFHVVSETAWASTSIPTATLTEGALSGSDGFGAAVAASPDGTTAFVGAPGTASGNGNAYVYHVASESAWVTTSSATATLAPAVSGGSFGSSVAVSSDGTTALVGEPTVGTNTGAAAVFHAGSESAWAAVGGITATLSDSTLSSGASFGSAVSLSGDGSTALVGAPGGGHGRADIFEASSEGSWASATSAAASLTASSSSELGTAVALSSDGTVALAGDPEATVVGIADLYTTSSERSWATTAAPTASLTDAALTGGSQLGSAIGLSNNGATVAIGAPGAYNLFGATDVFHALITPTAPTITDVPSTNAYGGGFSATVSTNSDGTTSVTSSTPAVCTAGAGASPTVQYVGIGTCTLTPHVAASSIYSQSDGAPVDIAVTRAVPTVSISNLPAGGKVGGGFTATVLTNSDGATSVTTSTPSVCSVAGLAVSFLANGTCTLTGHVTQGTDYLAADGSPQSLSVSGLHGYWLVGSDGGIFNFGSAGFYGSTGNLRLSRPVVGISPTATGTGYWLVASDGGVFAFNAPFVGSLPGLGLTPYGSGLPHSLAAPIVGIVPASGGRGYFMVGADGGVFAFNAQFAGSCPDIGGCVGKAVGVVPDATGSGYWLVTTTGNVYAFGDANFFGAPGPQGTPITSVVPSPDGNGYWILDGAGQVFAYGDTAYLGAPPAAATSALDPATAIFADSDGGGYWIATAQGKVYSFGDAPNDGDMSATTLNGSIVGAAGF